MKTGAVSNKLVGLQCRRNNLHAWVDTGDSGIEVIGDAVFYIRAKCVNGCGALKTRRFLADGYTRATWEESSKDRLTYTDPDYLLKKGEDKDEVQAARQQAIGAAVIQMCDPKGTLSKPKPAKKAAAKKVTATRTATKKTPAKKVTAERVADPQPLKRASQRKPAASVSGRSRAAKQPTTRRTKQSA